MEVALMEQNVMRFEGRARIYDRYRERYDAEIILPLLRQWCRLTSHWKIADIGAGTGMLADVFLANGNQVIAVEPNGDMRTMCEGLHADTPLLTVQDGTAETTGLVDASVNVVAVGRALHWFDLERTMKEFRRVLKPDGWVAVIAFGRSDIGREENVAFEKMLQSTTNSKESTHAAYEAYRRLSRFFDGGEYHHKTLLGEMKLDWESLRGLTLSLSHAPLESSPKFAAFERSLREYYEKYAVSGAVTIQTRYWFNVGRFPDERCGRS